MIAALLLLMSQVTEPADAAQPQIVVLVGAGGESQYETAFAESAAAWERLQDAGLAAVDVRRGDDVRRDAVRERLGALVGDPPPSLWLVLIGHGTFDGETAKFNVPGPDLTAGDLREPLDRIDCPQVVINTTSASAPFLNALSRPGRVIVTATKAGTEQNLTRFGREWAAILVEALPEQEPARWDLVDLDKDRAVSLLELAVAATGRTAATYDDEGRLATEHSLLDDNGDALGTRLDRFDGTQVAASDDDAAPLDGRVAGRVLLVQEGTRLTSEQLARRAELEAELERLKARRPDPIDDRYLDELEAILVPLSRLGTGR